MFVLYVPFELSPCLHQHRAPTTSTGRIPLLPKHKSVVEAARKSKRKSKNIDVGV